MKLEDTLRDQDHPFEELVDSLPQAVWTCNILGECIYVNHYVEEFTGASIEQLLGWGWLDFIHPDDRWSVNSTSAVR